MSGKPEDVQVEIFGQVYSVRGGADPAYLAELAAQVDARMREVSQSAGAVDSLRVAVLASLNLADECSRLRAEVLAIKEEAHRKEHHLRSRAASLAKTLGSVVEE
jgi:cell division protein ZapA